MRTPHLLIVLMLLLLAACSSVKGHVSSDGAPGAVGKLAVPRFVLTSHQEGRPQDHRWLDKTGFTTHFVNEMKRRGYQVVSEGELVDSLGQRHLEAVIAGEGAGLVELSGLTGADTVVFGVYHDERDAEGGFDKRDFRIRAVRVKDGQIVWDISSECPVNCDPMELLQDAIERL
jgi:hypothetical protein